MEASLHPDGGYYALKDGEAPAQSMRSKNLRHVVWMRDVLKFTRIERRHPWGPILVRFGM
jgi:hypothetical protein